MNDNFQLYKLNAYQPSDVLEDFVCNSVDICLVLVE